MWPYKQPIKNGSPWFDYKEAEKTGNELFFIFKIDEFQAFLLREICVTFPCVAVSGNTQLPLKVTAQVSSTQNQFSPREIPAELFSSPSQNFRLGILDEEAQGMRLMPVVFNFPCDKGDTITIIVSGVPTLLTIGCMISGRKYGGNL